MNEGRTELLKKMTGIIEEAVPAGPLREYIMVETRAVCKQSDSPYDDIASILFCSASSALQVGRRILGLRHEET